MMSRFLVLLAAFCFFTASAAAAQDYASLRVKPQTIDIGAFYKGAVLTATGSIPAGSEAVIRFIGAPRDFHMKQKGKVGGILWMNLASVTFEGAPSVCLITSAADFKSLDEKGTPAAALRLSGLKNSIRIKPGGAKSGDAFAEFVKLKEKEGFYRETPGDVSYASAPGGRKIFRANMPLPSGLTQGVYRVELYAVKNGRIAARAEQTVRARLTGLPALLSRLAFGHPALYGVLASAIALFAGLGIGLVFRSRRAH